VDIAAGCKLLEKSGAWYAYNGEKIAQGREKAKQYFEQNPQAAAALEKSVREKFFAEGGKLEEIVEVGFEPVAVPAEPTVSSEEEK
jgi:recombination protein RecA